MREDFVVDESSLDVSHQEDPEGYYAVLGLRSTATAVEIRQAFLTLSQSYHTDKHSSQDPHAQSLMNTRFQQIQQAYQVLSDPRQRAAYDHSGTPGVERLALVPVTATTKEDILRVLDVLQREAEIRSTAKMLGATGSISMTYSIAHLFVKSKGVRRPRIRPQQLAPSLPKEFDNTPAPQEVIASQPSTQPCDVSSESASAAATGDAAESTPVSAEGTETQQPSNTSLGEAVLEGAVVAQPGDLASQPTKPVASNQVVIREVTIDGQKTVVAILPQHMQERLSTALKQQGGEIAVDGIVGGGASDTSSPSVPSSIPASQQPTWVKLGMCLFPRAITANQSFTHAFTNTLMAQFRVLAATNANSNELSVATQLDYTPSGLTAVGSTWRVGTRSIKWVLFHRRILSPIWTIKNRLSIIDGTAVLGEYRLSLIRKLSATAELASTICWGIQGGFFESTLGMVTAAASQIGAHLKIGYNNLTLTAYRVSEYDFDAVMGSMRSARRHRSVTHDTDADDDVGEAIKKHKGIRGKLQQSINISPFTGQTNVAYELWWHRSRLQHFGIGISAAIPITVSPIHPPFFLSMSTNFITLCQFHLLYARGEHRISIPVIVSVSKKLHQGLLWLSLPWCVYRLATTFLRPIRRAIAARNALETRKSMRSTVESARKDALKEQAALETLVQRKIANEQKVIGGGLIIINAQYGVLRPTIPVLHQPYPLSLDVTIALQNYVSDSKLLLPEGRKHVLTGFYDVDPATEEVRHVEISYWFRGTRHSVLLEEVEAVELPQAAHREVA